jgi:hypothetical protein
MKYIWFVLAASLLLQACKKKACCDIPVAPDFMLAQKNGMRWEASPSGSNLTGDTIIVSGISNDEQIAFKIRFDGLGYYTLKANENYYKIKGASAVSYKPDPTHINNVTIIAYNQTGKIIQGFFELRFIKISDDANNSAPDKIILSEGKFKATLNH